MGKIAASPVRVLLKSSDLSLTLGDDLDQLNSLLEVNLTDKPARRAPQSLVGLRSLVAVV